MIFVGVVRSKHHILYCIYYIVYRGLRVLQNQGSFKGGSLVLSMYIINEGIRYKQNPGDFPGTGFYYLQNLIVLIVLGVVFVSV